MNLFKRKKTATKDVAKQRLQVVLIQDRTQIPPRVLDQIKNDIIHCITKYVDIDPSGLDISFGPLDECDRASATALMASIPILGVKSGVIKD